MPLNKHSHYLKWNLLGTTDSDKNIERAEKELFRPIYKIYENVRCLQPIVVHFIIHQQVL